MWTSRKSASAFLGLGLPLEIVSWGSMLSLSEKALLSGSEADGEDAE